VEKIRSYNYFKIYFSYFLGFFNFVVAVGGRSNPEDMKVHPIASVSRALLLSLICKCMYFI
jgi:hypothetical protein